MAAVTPGVRACGRGARGSVQVRVIFRGIDGQATDASIASTDLPESVRACVIGVVRTARVPAFEQETLTVSYPFRL